MPGLKANSGPGTIVTERNDNPSGGPVDTPLSLTIDGFHQGRFFLVQSAGTGHRAGMDAMLLAATIAEGAQGRLADLGAGAGAAGLAVASRLAAVDVALVERAPQMLECARRTLALEQNAALASRVSLIEADVGLRGAQRVAAGLADSTYDYVIMNPPFNNAEDRRTPDPLKAEAHAMDGADLFERWLRTAGAILRPGGQVSLIARPQSLIDISTSLARRFGGVEVTPVMPRAGDDAIRILVTAIKGSRARMVLRDRILVHQGQGRAFSPQMHDLSNGLADWPRRT